MLRNTETPANQAAVPRARAINYLKLLDEFSSYQRLRNGVSQSAQRRSRRGVTKRVVAGRMTARLISWAPCALSRPSSTAASASVGTNRSGAWPSAAWRRSSSRACPASGIEGFEKLVVLKRILPQHALDPELLRMFLDEARLAATLTHPHITEVYDVGADGDAPFFAMEYVHGANLREMLRAQGRAAGNVNKASAPLPLAHAVTIVAAAAAGLHYAHERLGPGGEPLGIVHRDVSPSNVLVSYDGAVKVSDFGIAKWAYQRTRTQEGTLKGKFAYMSPEQCRGAPRRSTQRHLRARHDPLRADDGRRRRSRARATSTS